MLGAAARCVTNDRPHRAAHREHVYVDPRLVLLSLVLICARIAPENLQHGCWRPVSLATQVRRASISSCICDYEDGSHRSKDVNRTSLSPRASALITDLHSFQRIHCFSSWAARQRSVELDDGQLLTTSRRCPIRPEHCTLVPCHSQPSAAMDTVS